MFLRRMRRSSVHRRRIREFAGYCSTMFGSPFAFNPLVLTHLPPTVLPQCLDSLNLHGRKRKATRAKLTT